MDHITICYRINQANLKKTVCNILIQKWEELQIDFICLSTRTSIQPMEYAKFLDSTTWISQQNLFVSLTQLYVYFHNSIFTEICPKIWSYVCSILHCNVIAKRSISLQMPFKSDNTKWNVSQSGYLWSINKTLQDSFTSCILSYVHVRILETTTMLYSDSDETGKWLTTPTTNEVTNTK